MFNLRPVNLFQLLYPVLEGQLLGSSLQGLFLGLGVLPSNEADGVLGDVYPIRVFERGVVDGNECIK